MSMKTWVEYGIGIDTTKLEEDFVAFNPDFENAYDKIMLILEDAPMFKDDYMTWLDDNMMELNEEGIEFCFTWEGFGHGLGEMLRCIIKEKYGVELCNPYDEEEERNVLMYEPLYPWQMGAKDISITRDSLDTIFDRYSMILCNVKADVEQLSATYNA